MVDFAGMLLCNGLKQVNFLLEDWKVIYRPLVCIDHFTELFEHSPALKDSIVSFCRVHGPNIAEGAPSVNSAARTPGTGRSQVVLKPNDVLNCR
jgi:hypothetical protein